MDIRKALPATPPDDCFTGTVHVEFEPGGTDDDGNAAYWGEQVGDDYPAA